MRSSANLSFKAWPFYVDSLLQIFSVILKKNKAQDISAIIKSNVVFSMQRVNYILFIPQSSAEPAADSDTDSSISALSNLSGLSGEESWKPTSGKLQRHRCLLALMA